MNELVEYETFSGTLMRVLSADAGSSTVYAQNQNGQTTHFVIKSGALPIRGAVILLGDDQFWLASKEAWLTPNTIGIVRSISSDCTLLIDDGLSLKTGHNYQNLEISENNTVEYNDIDGVVRIVSELPIRSRDHGLDAKEILKAFQVDTSGGGPTFDDFGGYPHVVERARDLIETQIGQRKYLDKIGARPVRGVLFTGPPGTGKTHLARIIAHESKADFFLVSGPSIVSKWVGDSEDTLRKIFDAATESPSGKAIIFFDEIDSIAERRSGDSHEASRRLVAQLLTLMDGFNDRGRSIVIIAATNRVDSLDPALTRPGRFDWEIEFGIPDLSDRSEILRVGARNLNTEMDLPIEDIAVLTENWSAADLSSIWSEAALITAGDSREAISAEDLAQAFERLASRPRRDDKSGKQG